MDPFTVSRQAPAIGSCTHRGVGGKENQDRNVAFRIGPGNPDDWSAYPAQSRYAVAVADGVTSQAAGADASGIAVQALKRVLCQDAHGAPPKLLLEEAFLQVNSDILSAVAANPSFKGMSTTLVAAMVQGWHLFVAHVGDSRAYLIRGNTLSRLTVDHTWVQEALDAGRLTQEAARVHPNRHTILRFLGSRRAVQIDGTIIKPGTDGGLATRQLCESIVLEPGDALLLCTDGITDKIEEDELLRLVRSHQYRPRQGARTLVETAVSRGETDNITAVLMVMPHAGLRGFLAGLLPGSGLKDNWNPLLLGALAFLLVAALWLFFQEGNLPLGPGSRTTAPAEAAAGSETSTPTPFSVAAAAGAVGGNVAEPFGTPVGLGAQPARLTILPSPTATWTPRPTSTRFPPSATPSATLTAAPSATPTTAGRATPAVQVAVPLPATLATPTVSPTASPTVAATDALTATLGSAGLCVTCTVTLDGPLDATLHGNQIFRWTPNFELGDKYLFEFVFWQDGKDSKRDGFSPIGAGEGTTTRPLNLDEIVYDPPDNVEFQYGTCYWWGVWLVDAEDRRTRIKPLSEGHRFLLLPGEPGPEQNDAGRGECGTPAATS